MKIFLYFCMLTTLCYSKPLEKRKTLTAPYYFRINVIDEPQAFDISWAKVGNANEDDPVLGYKIKVIQVKKIKKNVMKYNSDTEEIEHTLVEEYPRMNINKVPEGNFTILSAPAEDHPRVRFEGWKHGVAYEITVLAYTEAQEGPWSSPTRVRVHDSK